VGPRGADERGLGAARGAGEGARPPARPPDLAASASAGARSRTTAASDPAAAPQMPVANVLCSSLSEGVDDARAQGRLRARDGRDTL
jgi:hypothetical protein